jgi:hypothetical protein
MNKSVEPSDGIGDGFKAWWLYGHALDVDEGWSTHVLSWSNDIESKQVSRELVP